MRTFRDDDVNVYTDLTLFCKVNDLFRKYNVKHYCSVEMCDLWRNKSLWYFLVRDPNIIVCLHGWKHDDYGVMPYEQANKEIRDSLQYWRERVARGFGENNVKPIRRFFPPWNSVGEGLIQACHDNGLMLDNRTGNDVYGFHWWDMLKTGEFERLEGALREDSACV